MPDAIDLLRSVSPSPPAQRRAAADPLDAHALVDPLQRSVAVPSGGGSPLAAPLRSKMEGAFNQDFSNVRVHEGEHATQLGAIAFTQGENVHFAPGRYDPGSEAGQRLVGHELAHVVQQRAGQVQANGEVGGVPLNDDVALESAADKAADQAMQQMAVQRMEEEDPTQQMAVQRMDEEDPTQQKAAQRMEEEDPAQQKAAQRMEEEDPTQQMPAQRSIPGDEDEQGAQVI